VKNLEKQADGSYNVGFGCQIEPTIQEAVGIAQDSGKVVAFHFNDVAVSVTHDSDPALIYRDWSRAMSGYIAREVGPYPKAELTEAELASDAEIAMRLEQRQNARRVEQERLDAERRKLLESELAGQGPISVKDGALLEFGRHVAENSTDGYSMATVNYAITWARLMEKRMGDGMALVEIARQAGHDANVEGITGFMYGCAVSTLARFWIHGEALRIWHNLDTQVGKEGERANETGSVLNPALLVLGPGK